MNDEPTKPEPEFKIRLDDETHEPENEAIPDTDMDGGKNNRRISVPMILGSILILFAIAAGYYDIRKRVDTVYSSGERDAQNLSMDLQSKFSALSVKFAEMEVTIKKLSEMQTNMEKRVGESAKNLDSLNGRMKKAGRNIEWLTLRKAAQKKVDSDLAKVDKKIGPISKGLKKAGESIDSLDKRLDSRLGQLQGSLREMTLALKNARNKIAAVQAEKSSKKELLTEIRQIENSLRAHRNNLKLTKRRLDTRIGALEKQLGIQTKTTGSPVSTTAPSAGKSAQTPTQETTNNSLPKPGQMIEQDINR